MIKDTTRSRIVNYKRGQNTTDITTRPRLYKQPTGNTSNNKPQYASSDHNIIGIEYEDHKYAPIEQKQDFSNMETIFGRKLNNELESIDMAKL